MLSQSEIEYVDSSFGVYDQDWRFYSAYLGEPFLLEDRLAYFDGANLFYYAFPLRDCKEVTSYKTLIQAFGNFPHTNRIRGFQVVGCYQDLPEKIVWKDLSLDKVQDSTPVMPDAILNVEAFSWETGGNAYARLARNAARNKNIKSSVRQISQLGYEHILLIEKFFATHATSPYLASSYLAIPSVIKNDNTFVFESRYEESLIGYAIVSRINAVAACMNIGFYDNSNGSRASDAIHAAMIEWAQTNKIKRLHLGYSGTESLRNYKRKWGANLDGPTYRKTQYARDVEFAEFMKSATYPWRDRIYLSVLKQKN